MPHLAYSQYEWDHWNLFHKVSFDGPNKLILVSEGTTTLDIKTDVYSAWKEWVVVLGLLNLHDENPGFLQAIRAIGGEPTVGVASIGSTFFLTNGWRLKSYPGNYTLQVNGNIFVAAYRFEYPLLNPPKQLNLYGRTQLSDFI